MKVLLPSCVIVLILIVIGGCKVFGFSSIEYSASVHNIGSETIYINPLMLYKGALTLGGEYSPGHEFTIVSSFGKKPVSEQIIDWKIVETGEKLKTKVRIEPPAGFYNEKSPEIIFYFDPDNREIHVAYQISKKSNKPAVKLSDGSEYQEYDIFYLDSNGKPSIIAERCNALLKRKPLEELQPLLNTALTENTIDKLDSSQPFLFNISDFELRTMKCNVETILEFSKKMSQNKRLSEGALEYFEDMKSPTVKLYWAMLFLQNNEATAETNNYLKDALKTSKGKEQLTEWLGGESRLKTFEDKLNKL